MIFRTGLGQDSHRFEDTKSDKPLVLAGVLFAGETALKGNSDADVVLHALCNAISGVSGVNILGKVSDELCQQGITDSQVYLAEAIKTLKHQRPVHISISLECLRPKITPKITEMKTNIARLMDMAIDDIGITATTGEGLTDFGKGLGIQALVVLTVIQD